MFAQTIEDKKEFTKHLFIEDTFDYFLLCKANFHHNIDYTIDGKLNANFFDSEDQDAINYQKYVYWKEVKPLLFQMIKGKRSPLAFQIVFSVTPKQITHLIEKNHLSIDASTVEGLYLNINFSNQELLATSGISLSIFSLDRSLEQVWEENLTDFFTHNHFC